MHTSQKLHAVKGLSEAKAEKMVEAARKVTNVGDWQTGTDCMARVRRTLRLTVRAPKCNRVLLASWPLMSDFLHATRTRNIHAYLVCILASPCAQRQREIVRITCGASAVDQLLGGGFAETKCITEQYGEFRWARCGALAK